MSQIPYVPPIDVVRLQPLAEGLAHRLARQPADVDDLVQVGLLAYITDTTRMKRVQRSRHRARTQKALWATARTVLRRAMLGHYGVLAERKAAQAVPLDALDVGARLVHYASVGQQTDLLEMNDYLGALERACGLRARRIAQNLIEPTTDVVVAMQKRLVQRRRARRIPRMRFSPNSIRDAMALDEQTWAAELARVRGFTSAWLDKQA